MNISFDQKVRLLSVIHAPCLTEKSENVASRYQHFVFKVDRSANKRTIKQAVEFRFNVEVDSVRALNVKGKVKRFKQKIGRRNHWKKAYVSLKAGHHIDFNRE